MERASDRLTLHAEIAQLRAILRGIASDDEAERAGSVRTGAGCCPRDGGLDPRGRERSRRWNTEPETETAHALAAVIHRALDAMAREEAAERATTAGMNHEIYAMSGGYHGGFTCNHHLRHLATRRLTRARYRRRGPNPMPPQRPDEPDLSLYVEEAVTRRMVEDVIEEVRDMRDRMTNLLFLIAGSVLVDILTRMRGG